MKKEKETKIFFNLLSLFYFIFLFFIFLTANVNSMFKMFGTCAYSKHFHLGSSCSQRLSSHHVCAYVNVSAVTECFIHNDPPHQQATHALTFVHCANTERQHTFLRHSLAILQEPPVCSLRSSGECGVCVERGGGGGGGGGASKMDPFGRTLAYTENHSYRTV